MYVRGMNDTNDTWSSWAEVWTSTTDGSGSGLDADLLDGQNGSYYYAASNPSGYISSYTNTTYSAGSGISLSGTTFTNTSPNIVQTSVSGNAGTATALATNRTISLTGDVTGSASFNGTSNATINAVVANDSHSHTSVPYLAARDNRTISPSEDSSSKLRFGFTSFNNNNSGPYADYLHLRSYADSSGGNDNLLMLSKGSKNMRLWQQSYGSATAYSSYVDFWHTGNDGSGSGLDADLLDGKQADIFVSGSNTNKTNNTGNANGDLPSGFYDQNVGDMPTNTYYSYINMRHNNEANHHGAQIAVSFYSPDLYTRHYQGGDASGNGSFSAWDKHWRAGNDGSGSGLDADLLDGQHGSYYSPTSHSHSNYVTRQDGSRYTTDFNTIMTSGFYNEQANATNSAAGSYAQLIVAKGVDTGLQIYGGYSNTSLYFRGWASSGATFYSWKKIWNDHNDGSGSGLDADTVDGKHASDFALVSNTPQYFQQTTAPSTTSDGTMWLDMSDDTLYQRQDGSWVQISTSNVPAVLIYNSAGTLLN